MLRGLFKKKLKKVFKDLLSNTGAVYFWLTCFIEIKISMSSQVKSRPCPLILSFFMRFLSY